MKKFLSLIIFSFLMFGFSNQAQSATIFFDNFNSGANAAWGNEVGSWTAAGGVYNAQFPSNSPLTYSSVTTFPGLTDFTVDVDVNALDDGGIFLRSTDNTHGILLVTGGNTGTYNGLYWHVINGSVGAATNFAAIPGLQGSNVHITVDVVGNSYNAYVDGALKTTLVDNTFTSGKVALYDYSNQQSFDNFQISAQLPTPAPEPSSLILGSIVGIVGLTRRFLNGR